MSRIFYPRAGTKKKRLQTYFFFGYRLSFFATTRRVLLGNTECSMFAEQNRYQPEPTTLPFKPKPSVDTLSLGDFRLSNSYRDPKAPWHYGIHNWIESFKKKPSLAQLSLYRELEQLLEHSPEKDSVLMINALLETALHILSLRQEMTGERDTIQIVNAFTWDEATRTFDFDVTALEKKFLLYLQKVPASHRESYIQEIEQVLFRLRSLGKFLAPVDFSLPPEMIQDQLKFLGFTRQQFAVTPALLRYLPHLRSQIHSIEAIESVVQGSLTTELWVGPRGLTIAPPHWLHQQGKSSFLWASDVVVSLEGNVPQAAILDQGKFSHSTLPTLLRAVSVNQQEQRVFTNRQEILEWMTILTDVAHIPAPVFLEHLLQQTGDFIPAPPFDATITFGELSLKTFLTEIEKVFQFEWERCTADPRFKEGLEDRLFVFATSVKQLIADNSTMGLKEIGENYRNVAFADLPNATDALSLLEQFKQVGLAHNPATFSKSFDWSMIDCVAGTPGSLAQQLQGFRPDVSSVSGLQSLMGNEKFLELQAIEGRSISNRSEFERICRQFNKDPKRFPAENWGLCQCPSCAASKNGLKNYLGECGWCLSCELKDDYGILGALPDLTAILPMDGSTVEDTEHRSLGLGNFVAGLANPKLYQDVFLIKQVLAHFQLSETESPSLPMAA